MPQPKGLKKPEVLIQGIEEYLCKVARAIPQIPGDVKLVEYLAPILQEKNEQSEMLRRALGFPANATLSRSLLKLLVSKEPSLSTLIRVCAQRIHQVLWRFKYTLQKIDEAWTDEELPKVAAFSNLCQPYLLALRPSLLDLETILASPSLESKDIGRHSESVADPVLYAVLRALEYNKEELSLRRSNSQLSKTEQSALDFLYRYLVKVCNDDLAIDDSSNAWWALRLGVESGDPRFPDLVGKLISAVPQIKTPSEEAKSASGTPEIYTPLRTSGYTVASISAMLETACSKISGEVLAQLEVMNQELVKPLQETPPSKHLYLASVHYEGLRAYLDYLENRELLFTALREGKVSISRFCPIGRFTCVDPDLENDVTGLRSWLARGKAKGKRTPFWSTAHLQPARHFWWNSFFVVQPVRLVQKWRTDCVYSGYGSYAGSPGRHVRAGQSGNHQRGSRVLIH